MPNALALATVGLVLLALAVAAVAVLFHRPPPDIQARHQTPLRTLECPHEAATQTLPPVSPGRAGHTGLTVELRTLFAYSRSASRWSR